MRFSVLSKRLSSLNRSLLFSVMGLTMVFSSMVHASTTPTKADLMDILEPYYSIYSEAAACQGTISGSYIYPNGDRDEFGYCVTIDRHVLVNTADGERLYVMVTGDLEFDGFGNRRMKGHALSGLAGMFVLKPLENDTSDKGRRWKIESAESRINAGASGYGLHDWKLIQLAPDKWGFVNEHSDMNQGYAHSGLIILTPQNQGIEESFFPSGFNDAGTGRCGESGQPACEDIQAKLYQVDKTTVVEGFYPLKVKVTGNKDGKYYKDKVYTLYYKKGKGYQVPKDYPIN